MTAGGPVDGGPVEGGVAVSWAAFAAAFAAEFALGTPPPPDARLLEDLGFDSLSMVYLLVLVEELTGEVLETPELAQLYTVGDAYELCLRRSFAGRHAPPAP